MTDYKERLDKHKEEYIKAANFFDKVLKGNDGDLDKAAEKKYNAAVRLSEFISGRIRNQIRNEFDKTYNLIKRKGR